MVRRFLIWLAAFAVAIVVVMCAPSPTTIVEVPVPLREPSLPPWESPEPATRNFYAEWAHRAGFGVPVAEAQTPQNCDNGVNPTFTSRLGIETPVWKQCRGDLSLKRAFENTLDKALLTDAPATVTAKHVWARGALKDQGNVVFDVTGSAVCNLASGGTTDDAATLRTITDALGGPGGQGGGDLFVPGGVLCGIGSTVHLRPGVRIRCGKNGGFKALAGLGANPMFSNRGGQGSGYELTGCIIDEGRVSGASGYVITASSATTGTADADSTTSLIKDVDAAPNWPTDLYKGAAVTLSGGGCSVTQTVVSGNTANTISVSPSFSGTVANCTYTITAKVTDVSVARNLFREGGGGGGWHVAISTPTQGWIYNSGSFDTQLLWNVDVDDNTFEGSSTPATNVGDNGTRIAGCATYLGSPVLFEVGCRYTRNRSRLLGGVALQNEDGLLQVADASFGRVGYEAIRNISGGSIIGQNVTINSGLAGTSAATQGSPPEADARRPAIWHDGKHFYLHGLYYNGLDDKNIAEFTGPGVTHIALDTGWLANAGQAGDAGDMTGTAATSSTTVDLVSTASQGWTTNEWANFEVLIRGAASCGFGTSATTIYARRFIVGNTASALWLAQPLSGEPDNCAWEITGGGMVVVHSADSVAVRNLTWDNSSADNTVASVDQLVIRNATELRVDGNTFTAVHRTGQTAARLVNDNAPLDAGAATAGTTTTLTVSGRTWSTNAYARQFVTVRPRSGCSIGAEETRWVGSNTATVLTLAGGDTFSASPNGCAFALYRSTPDDYGLVTSGASTTVVPLSGKSWGTNTLVNYGVELSGAGCNVTGQQRRITANTSSGFTATPAFSASPNTSCAVAVYGPRPVGPGPVIGNTMLYQCFLAGTCAADSWACFDTDDQTVGGTLVWPTGGFRGLNIDDNTPPRDLSGAIGCKFVRNWSRKFGVVGVGNAGVPATEWSGPSIHRTGSDCTSQYGLRGWKCTQESPAAQYVCKATECTTGSDWAAL